MTKCYYFDCGQQATIEIYSILNNKTFTKVCDEHAMMCQHSLRSFTNNLSSFFTDKEID